MTKKTEKINELLEQLELLIANQQTLVKEMGRLSKGITALEKRIEKLTD